MRLTLLQLPQLISPTNYISTIAIPPLGLAYLAAAARAAGHEVAVVDAIGEDLEGVWRYPEKERRDVYLRGLTHEAILERIDPATDVIGIGCMFSCQWPSTRTFIEKLRGEFPRTLLILGGEHVSAMPERVLEEVPADACVIGEGEATLVDLLAHLGRGGSGTGGLDDVQGVVWRSPDGIRRNPPRPRIRDVDSIPAPAWDLFPVERYIEYANPHGAVRGRSLPILASRGCPYACTFCSSAQMWTRLWRPRKPTLVVDEIVHLHETYEATDFHFEDLTAVVTKPWIRDFCKELLGRGLDVTWQLPSGTRCEAIDGEIAELMVASGCRNFSYSIESGSEETLRRIRKRIRLDQVHASARAVLKAGVRLQATFILGFPHETRRHVLATYREIARCAWIGFHEFHCCAFTPLPNTESFFELQRTQGLVADDDFFYSLFRYMDVARYRSWHPRWGDTRLKLLIYGAFGLFYALNYVFRPWRLPAEVYHYSRRSSQGKLGKLVRGLVRNWKLQRRARNSPSS
jgi:anaerobic magnesium-protoporphyrin IX monomethyl ester cyclase